MIKMKNINTGMSRKTQKSFKRMISFIALLSVLTIYACNDAKIDPVNYPMPVENAENTIEADQEKETEKVEISDEEILKPEVNSFKENGTYVYNPAVIPNWILDELQNDPKIVRAAKDVLVAINNLEEEYTLDEDLELTEDDMRTIALVTYYTNPLSSEIILSPTDKNNVYSIMYFPYASEEESETSSENTYIGASPEEAKEILDTFKDYVTDTINEKLTPDMSEKEMAAIIYEQLVIDFKFEPESQDYYLGSNGFTEGPVKGVTDMTYTSGANFLALYSFFLTQLHIDNRLVSGTNGFFTNDIKEKLGDRTPISYYWVWFLLQLDGEYYNCDIIFEKLMYNESYNGETGMAPEMTFFGMSDKKRNESYKVGKTSIFMTDSLGFESGQTQVPECPEDYVFIIK